MHQTPDSEYQGWLVGTTDAYCCRSRALACTGAHRQPHTNTGSSSVKSHASTHGSISKYQVRLWIHKTSETFHHLCFGHISYGRITYLTTWSSLLWGEMKYHEPVTRTASSLLGNGLVMLARRNSHLTVNCWLLFVPWTLSPWLHEEQHPDRHSSPFTPQLCYLGRLHWRVEGTSAETLVFIE